MHASHNRHVRNQCSLISRLRAGPICLTPAGHKALQYQDLKALTPQPDTRAAERELVIRLGGTMERYIWTMNGKKFSEA